MGIFYVFFGYFLWFSGLRLQKTCKNHKDRPNLGFFWVFFMVFWASMYGTCTRRKDGPYVFIYLKHAPSFGDNGSSYILINTPPSFGDSGSPDIFNTRSHLAITIHLPVHHISLTRPLFCRFRFIIYLKPRPLIWRFRYPIYINTWWIRVILYLEHAPLSWR